MNKLVITQPQLEDRATSLLNMIAKTNKHAKRIHIYCVPSSAIPVGYLLQAMASKLADIHFVIVLEEYPESAQYIIDDLIDSNKTRTYFMNMYPEIPFLVLMDKQAEGITDWVVWPWQNSNTASAEDIPLRLLQYIGEDVHRGGLLETPKRFLKAWEHYTSGYDKDPKSILKEFEDGAEQYNEMVLVKDIPVYSHCEHHLAPFYGVAHVAYIPNGKIVGLSKLARLVDIFMRRLQVQERLTNQIANTLEEALNPLGVAVVIECSHTCMIARGVQVQGSTTITSAMKGVFMDQPETRAEFMGLIKQ